MLKPEMMLCVMTLPLVVVGCTSCRRPVRPVREATTPPAWIMQPPRLADTAERDYFTLREADHHAKTTGRNRSILMSSVDRVAYTMGNSCNYWEHTSTSSSGV